MMTFRIRILVMAALVVAATQGVAESSELEFTGLVVDERRQPVADATLVARHAAQDVHARTGEDGRFRFVLNSDDATKELAYLLVRSTGDSRALAAFSSIPSRGSRQGADEFTLVLKPVQKAVLRVLAADDAPVSGVRVQIVTPSQYRRTVIEELVSDSQGCVTVQLPTGYYTAVISDARYAGLGHDFELPTPVQRDRIAGVEPLVLRAKAPRRIVVRVIDDSTNAPVPGASTMCVYGKRSHQPLYPLMPRPLSDESGHVTFERIPVGQRVWVSAGAHGPLRAGGVEVGAEEAEAELRLQRTETHTAAWPIERNEHAPPAGARVYFRTDFHRDRKVDRPGTFNGKRVVVPEYHQPSDYGYAVYQEDRAAFLTYELEKSGKGEDGLELVSQTGRFLPVTPFRFQVVDAAGHPLSGATVSLQGRYLIRDGDGRLTRAEHERVQLDADGRFEGEGVLFSATHVQGIGGRGVPSDFRIGTLLPASAERAAPVFQLPPIRQVEAHVLLDGMPAVHAEIDFYFNGHIRSLAFEPGRGIVRFSVIHDQTAPSHYTSVSAPGYVSAHPVLDYTLPDPIVIDVALHSALDISLVLEPEPENWVDGRDIELHRFDAKDDAWRYAGDASYRKGSFFPVEKLKKQGHRCWRAFMENPPGRYRFVHTPTGLSTGPFEIDRSKPTWVVPFDVIRHRKMSGKLVGGGDLDLSGAWIIEQGGVPGLTWNEGEAAACRAVVKRGNTFTLRVPLGRESTYVVRHPLIRDATFRAASSEEAAVEVDVTPKVILRVPLELHAEEALGRIRDVQSPDMDLGWFPKNRTTSVLETWELAWLEHPEVRLGVKDGRAITWQQVPRVYVWKERALLVPLDGPGTYTLWIDAEYLAPTMISNVEVPAEGRTIAAATLRRGSWCIVSFPAVEPNKVQSARATATFIDGKNDPELVRRARVRDVSYREGSVDRLVLIGLPAGAYEVELTIVMEHGPDIKKTRRINVDGESDVAWSVDVRAEPSPTSKR